MEEKTFNSYKGIIEYRTENGIVLNEDEKSYIELLMHKAWIYGDFTVERGGKNYNCSWNLKEKVYRKKYDDYK